MTPSQRLQAQIDALLKDQAPRIRDAFLQAIQDAKSVVRIEDVVALLSQGDIEGAARLLEIDRLLLAPLDQAISDVYMHSGAVAMQAIVDTAPRAMRLVARFDGRNPVAENWLRDHSSTLVTEIVADQRDGIREALRAGMEAGRNPRGVALEVVGRIDKVSKRRVGGLLGLTSQQMRSVANARAELLSGDPAQMRAYLERKLRDRRLDGIVKRAIKDGKPVAAKDVERLMGRYSDRLLAYRGTVIARTEALESFANARWEATRQLIEAGTIQEQHVTKVWSATLDKRTRDSHVALNGKKADMREAFVSPLTGARMLFPMDRSQGAPGSEIIQCRCGCSYVVDWIWARTGLAPTAREASQQP
jgi:hypothetical protein